MNESLLHESTLRIAGDHPALPGHFPGSPLVPGVVLLDHVLLAAEQWLGHAVRISTLTQAKFNSPLLPEQPAMVQLQLRQSELRFSIVSGETLIAQGVITLASTSPGAHGVTG
jgi:3-hydroxyacyl-[acyl-carrier-protein] dehydratase